MKKKVRINEKINLLIFTNKNEFISELIKIFNEQFLKYGIKNFLLPGGKTPIDFYIELSKQNIDWSKITFALTDERLLDDNYDNSDESNFSNVNRYLIKSIYKTIKPKFIHLPKSNKKYDQSTQKEFLKNFSTFLGVGTDGHIASIFNDDYNENDEEIIFFTSKKHHKHFRVSWTLNSLLKSQAIFIILDGQGKKEIVDAIINSKLKSDMPYLKLLKNYKQQIIVLWNK